MKHPWRIVSIVITFFICISLLFLLSCGAAVDVSGITGVPTATVTPSSGSSITGSTQIKISFSKSMDTSTRLLSGTLITQSDLGIWTTTTNTNDTLTISPLTTWTEGGGTIILECRDLSGNPITKLTLEYAIDLTFPTAMANPANGAHFLGSQTIVIQFSETMTTDTLELSGTLASESDMGVWSTTTNENDTVTINPSGSWSIGAATLTVDCSDLAAYPVDTLSLSYYVAQPGDTVYVSAASGSDSYLGSSWEDAVQTIQKGIDLSSNGKTVLVANGTYSGDDNERIRYYGKAITVESVGGAENCIVDADDNMYTFMFVSSEGADSVLDGFTIKGATTSGIVCQDTGPTIKNCIIRENIHNSGDGGAGIFCYGATPTIINCLITENDNQSVGGGGLSVQYESHPVLINCTVTNNTTTTVAGGIDVLNSDITLKNTIIWDNEGDTADEISIYDSGISITVTLDHCDYANEEGDIFLFGEPTIVETACINVDPLFQEPESGNFQLLHNSPCLDTGLNASLPGDIMTDLNGRPRIVDGDGSLTDEVDIGCYELQVGFVPLQYATIQAALDAALTGAYILVADGTYTGSGNRDLDPGGKAVFLMSQNGPSSCIIDCQDLGRGFYIHTGETANTLIQGFTVRNGLAATNGGAIYCQNAGPFLNNCIIESSTVSAGDGGGVYCDTADSIRFVNCIIQDNSIPTADFANGGGICIENTLSAEMVNCLIANNSDSGGVWGGGGGIACIATEITMTNCTVTDNYSAALGDGGGGGIFCRGSVINFNNSIVWGNEQINDYTYEVNIWDSSSYPSMPSNDFHARASCLDMAPNAAIIHRDNLTADGDCVSLAPLYVDADNGDYHLQETSPVKDEGNNGYIPSDISTDLDGNTRIVNTTVDMGAYEYQ